MTKSPSDLLVDEPVKEATPFDSEVHKDLEVASTEATSKFANKTKDFDKSWAQAKVIVEKFQPVQWVVWRLTKYIFSSYPSPETPEGLVMGLRRLLFAAASDSTLGTGEKVNNLRNAVKILPSDVIAAIAIIHSICRRLEGKDHERIWRPVLDDALLRAHIGFHVGKAAFNFGGGRGMLTGFAGRIGLVVLLATGKLEQARKALELLAGGMDIADVGVEVYKVQPLHVSGMLLTAAGCGVNPALGIMAYDTNEPLDAVNNDDQIEWLSAFYIIEGMRTEKVESIENDYWEILGITSHHIIRAITTKARSASREGYNWNWLSEVNSI